MALSYFEYHLRLISLTERKESVIGAASSVMKSSTLAMMRADAIAREMELMDMTKRQSWKKVMLVSCRLISDVNLTQNQVTAKYESLVPRFPIGSSASLTYATVILACISQFHWCRASKLYLETFSTDHY